MTDKDPVVSNVAAVGASDEGVELHVVVENHGEVHGDVAQRRRLRLRRVRQACRR